MRLQTVPTDVGAREGQRRGCQEDKRDLKDIECFNCHQKGHYVSNCSSNVLFCREKLPGKVGEQTRTGTELTRKGSVEGRAVDNILLDTGCLRTLVHQEWVSRGRMLDGEAVAIRCAHEDTVLYLVALLQVVVGTRTMEVRAAVSETLPVDVLLENDVPELSCCIQTPVLMPWLSRHELTGVRCSLRRWTCTCQKEQELGAIYQHWVWTKSKSGCPALMMISLAEDVLEPGNPELRKEQNDMPMPRTWQKMMTWLWLMSSQKRTRTLLTSLLCN